MPALRCTQKLLAQLGERHPPALVDEGDDWHANLIWVERKKLVLFCSTSTLLCCVSPPVTKSEIQALNRIFLSALQHTLQYEGFPDNDVEHCCSLYQSMPITKTNDRSILGTMTDCKFHLTHWINRYGGLAKCNLGKVIHHLNEMPQVKRNFYNSLEAFKQSLIRGIA